MQQGGLFIEKCVGFYAKKNEWHFDAKMGEMK